MESSERVKMLEKQRCRAGCVNPCERNPLSSPLSNTDGGANRLSKQAVNGKRGVPRAKEIGLDRNLER